MPSAETLILFTAAAVLMNLSPGPANFYVMSRSIAQGRRGGFMAAAGLAMGGLVHVFAAALGLSALFAYSPTAYTVLKLVGAAYLIYLGMRYLLGTSAGETTDQPAEAKAFLKVFWESALVEVTNPKTALFFLAFMPQFVDTAAGPPGPQLLLLGAIVTASAIPCDLLVAYFSDKAGVWMKSNPAFGRIQNRVSGSILVGLGLYVALDARD